MNYTESKNTFFAKPKDDPKDRIDIEIGDSKQADFFPQLKIMRWENEVNFSIRLKHDELAPTFSQDNEKIKWFGEKVEAHFYDIQNEEHPEGASEFEVILKEKPKKNVVEFTLVDKDVEYSYQPSLTDEIKVGDKSGKVVSVTETDAFDKDGNSLTHRPENVVGSYAVYAKTPKTNWTGGKEYKVGKVGHIFRPKIIDSVGTEVWGDLHIENGILSVTIPQDFLDKAVYPVRHAAGLTFGYNGAGDSTNGGANNFLLFSTPGYAGGDGTGVSITALSSIISGTAQQKYSLYTFSTPNYNPVTNGVTSAVTISGSTKTAYTANFVSAPTLSSATTYFIMMNQNSDSIYQYYDTGRTGHSCLYKSQAYTSFPAAFSAPSTDYSNSEYSIYVTYTSSAAGPAKLKTWNGLATAKIKTINNLAIAKVKTINGLV